MNETPIRVLLAVNRYSRRGRGAVARIERALKTSGHAVTIVECDRDPERFSARIALARDKADAVVIGGGDGTIVAAIAGLREADLPLLIVPLGTTNELARTLGIPSDIPAACRLIATGVVEAIDVGCVNGRYYINEASIGLSNHVVRNQTGDVKSRYGLLSIPIATIRSLRAMRPYRLEVERGDERFPFRSVQMTIANSNRFGGFVHDDDASITDGALRLYTINLERWWQGLSIIMAVALSRFPKSRYVTRLHGDRFVVRSRSRHSVFADGEFVTYTPAEFSVIPKALRVYTPPSATP